MKPLFWNVMTDIDFRLPLHLLSTGYWPHQPHVERKDGYRAFQWLQCTDGQGILEMEGTSYTVSKGQGMLLYPGVPHRYTPEQAPWTIYWVEFSGHLAPSMLQSFHFHSSTVLYLTKPELLLSRMHELNRLFPVRSPGTAYESSQLLYGLLVELFRFSSTTELRSNREPYEQLAPVLAYIEQHFNEPISLQDLADCLSVTPHYLCVLFQQTFGTRPFEYMNRYRIHRAKLLLQQAPEQKIQTITKQVGFESPSYFIKVFKQLEGMTPNAFRRLYVT
ncbi:helix-turn-helix transcriptional regulator [Paenibacillus whitsoniae]|uniref:AraC family transcriptional regulator n=1 Tax=Paenibacillus whitsoniae TaxID=2496558 RepID=A0A3S0A777_9BACL|nr:AraC family transcriptional regulator [Paenibacillus whitsoniae]RTE11253.1 AraC family transcriptional regulator [Paenibacillus whitsoniae]